MLVKDVFSHYFINLLLSFVLAIVIVVLRLESNFLNITYIILGSFLGTFLLDLDYLVFAFFAEPNHHTSIRIKEFVAQRNYLGVFGYIATHKDSFPRPTLHSAFFQVILAVTVFYVLTSSDSIFGKAFVLSGFLQSVFYLGDMWMRERNVDKWFWVLKEKPTKRFFYAYFISCFAVFIYSLSLI